MKDGQKIVFYGKGDQENGLEPGNIIVVVDELEHHILTRKGANLVITLELSLTEALCGCSKYVNTLDKRTLAIHTVPGNIFILFEF